MKPRTNPALGAIIAQADKARKGAENAQKKSPPPPFSGEDQNNKGGIQIENGVKDVEEKGVPTMAAIAPVPVPPKPLEQPQQAPLQPSVSHNDIHKALAASQVRHNSKDTKKYATNLAGSLEQDPAFPRHNTPDAEVNLLIYGRKDAPEQDRADFVREAKAALLGGGPQEISEETVLAVVERLKEQGLVLTPAEPQ